MIVEGTVSWPQLRAQAQARADALGAPTSRLEPWRYVDLRALGRETAPPLGIAQALARLKGLPGAGPLPPALIIDGVPCVTQPRAARGRARAHHAG